MSTRTHMKFKLIDDKSMFGENFKYILILTILGWMTYSLPSVQAAIQDATSFDSSSSMAAIGTTRTFHGKDAEMLKGKPILHAIVERRSEMTPPSL